MENTLKKWIYLKPKRQTDNIKKIGGCKNTNINYSRASEIKAKEIHKNKTTNNCK